MVIVKQIFRNKTGFLTKGFLALSFVLVFQFLNAQSDADTLSMLPPDTTIYVVPDRQASPSPDNYYQDEEEDNDDSDGEKEKDYFLQKWMQYRKLDSPEFRRLPDSAVQALKSDKNFWYANEIFEKEKKEKKENKEGSSFGSSFLNILLWALIIGGFAAFLIFFLANSNVRVFRRSRMVKTEDEEQETGDIFAINYQKEIDKAIQAGNYRLATRLMFLRLLRNLSDRNIIQYKQDRTNFDYLAQLHNTTWYEGFFRITRNYEYTWYGLFEVDREKFSVIRNDFEKFEKLMN